MQLILLIKKNTGLRNVCKSTVLLLNNDKNGTSVRRNGGLIAAISLDPKKLKILIFMINMSK